MGEDICHSSHHNCKWQTKSVRRYSFSHDINNWISAGHKWRCFPIHEEWMLLSCSHKQNSFKTWEMFCSRSRRWPFLYHIHPSGEMILVLLLPRVSIYMQNERCRRLFPRILMQTAAWGCYLGGSHFLITNGSVKSLARSWCQLQNSTALNLKCCYFMKDARLGILGQTNVRPWRWISL